MVDGLDDWKGVMRRIGQANGVFPPMKRTDGALYLMVQGTPVLGVYPLMLIELDDKRFIRYVSYKEPFPFKLQQLSGNPIVTIQITYTNGFSSRIINEIRIFQFEGVYVF